MTDWKHTASAIPNTLTVGTSSVEMFGSSIRRRGVIISPPTAGRISVSPRGAAVDGQGFVLVAGGPSLVLWWDAIGRAVQDPWNVVASAASTVFGFVEIVSDA